jgi:hypothetical protein
VEVADDNVRGIAVHIAGSGIAFADRGEHSLKGVPSVWQLFAVESGRHAG